MVFRKAGELRPRGFSLIEAAIVLAVVGLVIGGIWVAAAAVSRNHQIARFTSGMLFIVQNVKKYDRNPVSQSYMQHAITMGIVPADWKETSLYNIETPITKVSISSSVGIERAGDYVYIRLNFNNNMGMCTPALRALYSFSGKQIIQILGNPGMDDYQVNLNNMSGFDCATAGYYVYRITFQ